VREEFSPDHKRQTGISMEQQAAAELIASARRKKDRAAMKPTARGRSTDAAATAHQPPTTDPFISSDFGPGQSLPVRRCRAPRRVVAHRKNGPGLR
jgi:hypothetical protein